MDIIVAFNKYSALSIYILCNNFSVLKMVRDFPSSSVKLDPMLQLKITHATLKMEDPTCSNKTKRSQIN